MLVSSFPDKSNKSRGIFNYRLVKQLKGLREDVLVVFFRQWTPQRKIISSYFYDSIKVTQVCLPLLPISYVCFFRINNFICRICGWLLLKNQLKSCDIIHSVFITSNGIIAGEWAKKARIPHISQAIGSDVNSDLQKLVKRHNIKWMKQIDGIITNSFDLEKSLKNTVTNCPPVKTIYRGIEISEMEESDMTDQKYVFLYLGGLIPYRTLPFGVNTKGGISLMEAWKKAETKLIDNNCILQFGGPDSDNKIFKVWKQTLRYPERVKLLGKLAPEDINQLLSQSNIVVVPSMEEGLPNFLLESAARKKAAIGSTAGGIPEVIINGETGYIFEKGNIEQLTNLLLEASGNKEKVKQMGEAAYRRVKTNFNAENYSLNIMGFYKKIMNKCAE